MPHVPHAPRAGTAIILCGGRGSRAGVDKQLLPHEGTTLPLAIAARLRTLFPEIIIATNLPERYAGSGCVVVRDVVNDAGPLAGILTGLLHASGEYAYVTAGDMPWPNLAYIRWMTGLLETDSPAAVTARQGPDHLEPFNSVFAVRCAGSMRAALDRGERGVCRFLRGCGDAVFVPEELARAFSPDGSMFANINTRADVRWFLSGAHAPTSAARESRPRHQPVTVADCFR
jgi:molybdopterin-guanine dinucleotide biosynthesis protein A